MAIPLKRFESSDTHRLEAETVGSKWLDVVPRHLQTSVVPSHLVGRETTTMAHPHRFDASATHLLNEPVIASQKSHLASRQLQNPVLPPQKPPLAQGHLGWSECETLQQSKKLNSIPLAPAEMNSLAREVQADGTAADFQSTTHLPVKEATYSEAHARANNQNLLNSLQGAQQNLNRAIQLSRKQEPASPHTKALPTTPKVSRNNNLRKRENSNDIEIVQVKRIMNRRPLDFEKQEQVVWNLINKTYSTATAEKGIKDIAEKIMDEVEHEFQTTNNQIVRHTALSTLGNIIETIFTQVPKAYANPHSNKVTHICNGVIPPFLVEIMHWIARNMDESGRNAFINSSGGVEWSGKVQDAVGRKASCKAVVDVLMELLGLEDLEAADEEEMEMRRNKNARVEKWLEEIVSGDEYEEEE